MRLSTSLPVRRTKFANGLLRSTERYEAIERRSARSTSRFVQNDHELTVEAARIVQRFVREPAGERAVAKHRNDRLVAADEIPRERHAERRGHTRAGVTGAKRIVRRFAAHGEAGEAAALANGGKAVASSGQYLMHVGLVADVPNEPVGGKIEHAVQRQRQLDDAQVRREVAAVDGTRSNEQLANLTCQDVHLVALEALHVRRRVDALDDHWPVIRIPSAMPCAAATTPAESAAARGASRASQKACGQFHGLSIAYSGACQSPEDSRCGVRARLEPLQRVRP